MLDFSLMLQVKMLVVDRIHPQSDKLATVVKTKATGDQKLNGSPVKLVHRSQHLSVFFMHEVAESVRTPHGWDTSLLQVTPWRMANVLSGCLVETGSVPQVQNTIPPIRVKTKTT